MASVRQALVGVSEGADPICVGTGAHMQTQLLNNFMLDIAANKRHSLNTREKAANFVQMLWQYKSKACHSPTHSLRHCGTALVPLPCLRKVALPCGLLEVV